MITMNTTGRFDKLKWQREQRIKNDNIYTKKYEKTPKGFLMRAYRNMLSRVVGIQKAKFHLYKNKEILLKHDFYNWSLNNPQFITLFLNWEKSNYDRKLSPSVDRIDPKKGYSIENMRWLTHSENSKRGSVNGLIKRWNKTKKTKPSLC